LGLKGLVVVVVVVVVVVNNGLTMFLKLKKSKRNRENVGELTWIVPELITCHFL
jgi:hypothetical protein